MSAEAAVVTAGLSPEMALQMPVALVQFVQNPDGKDGTVLVAHLGSDAACIDKEAQA